MGHFVTDTRDPTLMSDFQRPASQQIQKWDSVKNCKMKFKLEKPADEGDLSDEDREDNLFDGDDEVKSEARERMSIRDVGDMSLLSYVLCIRTAARRYNDETLPGQFIKADYRKEISYYILPLGADQRVRVKEYAGPVFESIRRHSIDIREYLRSWSLSVNETFQASTGRSSSRFIFSSDGSYVLKTVNDKEARWLLRVLPAYQEYLKNHPNSLLLRYLGLYQLTEGRKSSFFIVTENVLKGAAPSGSRKVYDLKGSAVGRQRKEGASASTPFLDKDFLGTKLHMDSQSRDLFLKQVRDDAEFLQSQNLMDYSLLLCISPLEEVIPSPSVSEYEHVVPSMVYFCQKRRKQRKKKPETMSAPNLGAPPPAYSCLKRKKHTARPRLLPSRSLASLHPNTPNRQGVRSLSSPSLSSQSMRRETNNNPRDSHENISRIMGTQREVYHLGIIDILQKYDSKKKIAGFAKSFRHSRKELSTVHPKSYASRFVKFFESAVSE